MLRTVEQQRSRCASRQRLASIGRAIPEIEYRMIASSHSSAFALDRCGERRYTSPCGKLFRLLRSSNPLAGIEKLGDLFGQERPAHQLGHQTRLLNNRVQLLRSNRLLAIAERNVGIGMNLQNQTRRACCYSGA